MVYLHITDKARTLSGSQLLCVYIVLLQCYIKKYFSCAIFFSTLSNNTGLFLQYARLAGPKDQPVLMQNNYCCQKNDTFQRGAFWFPELCSYRSLACAITMIGFGNAVPTTVTFGLGRHVCCCYHSVYGG